MTTVEHIALISAVAVTLAVPIVARLLRGRFDPFEPIVLFVLAYGVMFVTRPAAMVADHHLAYDGPRMSTDVSATFTKMLVLAFLGAVAFVAGYEISLVRRPLSAHVRAPWHPIQPSSVPRRCLRLSLRAARSPTVASDSGRACGCRAGQLGVPLRFAWP